MIRLDGHSLLPADLEAIAEGAPCEADPAALARMAHNADREPPSPTTVLERKRQWLVGGRSGELPPEGLARAFILGHCAGVGEPLPAGAVRATIAARANVLLQGVSGCRPAAALALLDLLDGGPLPVVPCQGSVGAAGDLAPLSHIAREACGWGRRQTAFVPNAKEALALINGVSLSAALAGLAVARLDRLLDSAVLAAAMSLEALGTDAGCIDARPQRLRGHKGAMAVASTLRGLLEGSEAVRPGGEVGPFSLRCAPAVLGAAADALIYVRGVVEAELNGASDNPLLVEGPLGLEWVEAGNFHGASLSMAMDQARLALAQIATISERRTFRLSYGQLAPGLPSFLVQGTGLNSGFMLAQYTAASLTSELKGLCHPASVDAIPTIQHHEDHNSMATLSARLTTEALRCAEDVVGIEVLLAAQALDLRIRGLAVGEDGTLGPARPQVLPAPIARAHARVRQDIAFWEDDGYLHPALVAAGALVRSGALVEAARA